MKMEEKKDIAQRERFNKLLSIYGNALSELEKNDMMAYYAEDLSLSEIADNRHVSRNAVHLSIKHGEEELEKLEEKIKVLSSSSQVVLKLEDLQKEEDIMKIKAGLQEIEEVINHGI
jgi:uncharacterized protein